MITIKDIILIIVVHFLADFGLQTHDQAKGKSTDNKQLAYHCGTYSLVWLLMSYVLLGYVVSAIMFTLITFISHYWTDYVTSRISKKYFDKQDYHNGFVVVGGDQVLHYMQLFLTYLMLK